MLAVQQGEGKVKVDIVAQVPVATETVVLREWDGPQGRMQECQVDPPRGLRFKRKAVQVPVPRSKPLPGQKPPQERQQVRLVTRVVAADPAAVPRPALAALTGNFNGAEARRNVGEAAGLVSPAAAQPQQPAASEASQAAALAEQSTPANQNVAQQQDAGMTKTCPDADGYAAAPAQPPHDAPAVEPPAVAATCQTASAAAAAAAQGTATPAARPLTAATAAHAAAKTQAAGAAAGGAADMAAVASRYGFAREEIHAVLDQLPDGTPEERQAAQAALLARLELEAAVAALRPPVGGAEAAAAEAAPAEATADAETKTDAEVAAALEALLPDFLAAAPRLAAPEAPVAAALAAAEAGDTNGGGGGGLMTPSRLAAEKGALRARQAALNQELAQWDALQAQHAVLSPEAGSPAAKASAELESAEFLAVPESADIAKAQAGAHQQLTLQVEGLCAMVEGVTALLATADATTAQLQAAYETAAFASLSHVDSPATLVRRAIKPLPPPPTPAAERAAREA